MGASNNRSCFDENSTRQASESKSQPHRDEGLETGDEAAQEIPDDASPDQSGDAPSDPPNDAPPDPANDDAPELVSVICKLCQRIQRHQTAWEMTHCRTEPIEPEYYHLDVLVPECKALSIDLCVYNRRAVIRSEL